jgi:ADP-ribose pyrophosphatase
MDKDDVDVIDKETVFKGYVAVERYRLRHRLHGGGMSDVLDREVVERGHVSAVLPVDFARDKVVLIEQFRPGAFAAQENPWLVECVAGIIEPNETAEQVARREALEEAGCRVDVLIPVQWFFTTPGALTENVQLFCGVTDSRGIGGVHGAVHEGEDIKVHVVPVDQALEMVDRGEIKNAITLIALQWLTIHYHDLKNQGY